MKKSLFNWSGWKIYRLLVKDPDMIDKVDIRIMNEYWMLRLLREKPELVKRLNADNLKGYPAGQIIEKYPELAEKFVGKPGSLSGPTFPIIIGEEILGAILDVVIRVSSYFIPLLIIFGIINEITKIAIFSTIINILAAIFFVAILITIIAIPLLLGEKKNGRKN